jgi:hypothetical protein
LLYDIGQFAKLLLAANTSDNMNLDQRHIE